MSQLPQVGDQFGRYRIDGHIGQGGMGVVLSATDTGLDRRVALKVLSAALTGTEEFHQRFQREASVLARLSSPHVIDIFDYGIHDECPYIATQYVGGGDLGALLQVRGSMPPQLAARVCSQVADALSDAHRVDVVHRDVKPSNVLLRDADTLDLHAYLCDFGIARADSEGLTVPGSVAGTWSYLSPECGRGEPATVASDLYAVGCLFWAALTGRAPYRGTDVEIAMAHQQQPVPQLEPTDDFAAHANAILAGTMAKDPADRFPDADRLRAALLAAAAVPTSGVRPTEVAGTASAAGGGAGGRTPTPAPADPTAHRPPSHPSGSGAAPAPSYGPPMGSGQQPPYSGPPAPSGGSPSGSGQHSGGGRKKGLLVAGAAVLAVVLVIGGIVAVRALGGGDDGGDGAAGGPEATGLVKGDLDGDGLGDLQIVLQPADRGEILQRDLWTLYSEGDTFGTPEKVDDPVDDIDGDRRRRDLGDLDGDGEAEVVVAFQPLLDPELPLTVTSELSGGGTVDVDVEHPEPSLLSAVNVDDADGDGLDDLYVMTAQDDQYTVEVHLSDGEGGFGDPALTQTLPMNGKEPLADAGAITDVGDYDGDGLADVALLDLTDVTPKDEFIPVYETTISIYRNTGDELVLDDTTQTFRSGDIIDLNAESGDLDGDGDEEIMVVPGVNSDVLSLEVMDYTDEGIQAPAAWGAFNPITGQADATGIALSDVDGDGLADALNIDPAKSEENRSVVFVALSDGDSFATPERWARWQATNRKDYAPQITGAVFP